MIHDDGTQRFTLSGGSEYLIGRGDDCDLQVNHASVSRHHAILSISADGRFIIRDLGSANGTVVSGVHLARDDQSEFRIGEAIRLGHAMFVVSPNTKKAAPGVVEKGRFTVLVAEACATATPFGVVGLSCEDLVSAGEVSAALSRMIGLTIASFEPGLFLALFPKATSGAIKRLAEKAAESLKQAGITATCTGVAFPDAGTTVAELFAAAAPKSSVAAATSGEPQFGKTMEPILERLDRIALSDLGVLLIGPTGAGKEVLAERVHRKSGRSKKPFIRLNCGAFVRELLESELFGHAKGAFTGADRDKAGLLESASGGTVFLDEIGDLPLDMQVTLLRVLEDGQVRRVGESKTRAIDVRVVAATNRDLQARIKDGKFREDLYYRLAVSTFTIPALRERRDEIVPLAEFFAQRAAARRSMPSPSFSEASKQALQAHGWPGNIRELRNAIESATALADGPVIDIDLLPVSLQPARKDEPEPAKSDSEVLRRVVRRDEVVAALEKHGGNQRLASKELGVHRRTLMRWMDSFGIPRPRKGK